MPSDLAQRCKPESLGRRNSSTNSFMVRREREPTEISTGVSEQLTGDSSRAEAIQATAQTAALKELTPGGQCNGGQLCEKGHIVARRSVGVVTWTSEGDARRPQGPREVDTRSVPPEPTMPMCPHRGRVRTTNCRRPLTGVSANRSQLPRRSKIGPPGVSHRNAASWAVIQFA